MSGGAPAPLHPVPGVPWKGRAEWVGAADGARLRAALFPAQGAARGSVILNPGRTEPIEKFAESVAALQARGFAVLVHDWRGQGLSDPFPRTGVDGAGVRLGHARGWRPFVADLRAVLDAFAPRLPPPWIGLGVSMGGGLTLLAMCEGEARLAGALLVAPMLGLRLGGLPQPLVRATATLMGLAGQGARMAPPAPHRGEAMSGEEAGAGEGRALTHDGARWARFQAVLERAPELRVGEPSWGWLQFALSVVRRLEALDAVERLDRPVTVLAAGRDRLVAEAPQRRIAARLPRGRFLEIADAFHDIPMETDDRQAPLWAAFDALAGEVGA